MLNRESPRPPIAAVNTPEAELVRQHRAELIENLKARGVTQEQLVHEISRGLTGQVTVTGPAGEQSMADLVKNIPHAAGLAELLNGFKPKRPRKPKEPPPEPPAGTAPVPAPRPPSAPAAPTARLPESQPAPQPVPQPGAFRSHDDVATWTKERFPNGKLVAPHLIPVDVWNVIASEMDDLAKLYPAVAKDLELISTIAADFTNNARAIASASITGDRISFNPKRWQSVKEIKDVIKNGSEGGFYPRNR